MHTTLASLNARINRTIRYKSDATDYWQAPKETLARGAGDCEDYAIVKMHDVLAAGYPVDDVRLAYCRRTLGRTTEAHMVLDVGGWVLDNLGSLVSRWDERADLKPLFAFNATGFWVQSKRLDVDPQQRLGQWGRCCARARAEGSWLGW